MDRHIRIIPIEGETFVGFLDLSLLPIVINNSLCPADCLDDRVQRYKLIQILLEFIVALELVDIRIIPMEPAIDQRKIGMAILNGMSYICNMEKHP